jgi:hypothetical protein
MYRAMHSASHASIGKGTDRGGSAKRLKSFSNSSAICNSSSRCGAGALDFSGSFTSSLALMGSSRTTTARRFHTAYSLESILTLESRQSLRGWLLRLGPNGSRSAVQNGHGSRESVGPFVVPGMRFIGLLSEWLMWHGNSGENMRDLRRSARMFGPSARPVRRCSEAWHSSVALFLIADSPLDDLCRSV